MPNLLEEVTEILVPIPAPSPRVNPFGQVVEYLLAMPCEPKRRLGKKGLVERLRQRDRTQHAPPPTPDEIAAARDAEFQLRPYAFHCLHCPARQQRREFGCVGLVRFPISGAAEDWLVSLLPTSLNPADARTPERRNQIECARELLRRMRDLDVTGEHVDQLRLEGGYFRRAAPSVRKYGPFYRRTEIPSSQLLELMFYRRRVHPVIAELLCRALGAWIDGERPGDGTPEAVFTQPVEGDDDGSIAELKYFLRALMIARSLDLEVQTRADGVPGVL
jgi:hypothetical protein